MPSTYSTSASAGDSHGMQSFITTKMELQQLQHAIDRIRTLKFDLIRWMVAAQLAYTTIILAILIASL